MCGDELAYLKKKVLAFINISLVNQLTDIFTHS